MKIDESKIDLENYHFDRTDKNTAEITFNELYEFDDKFYTLLEIRSFTDMGSTVIPTVEYQFDENKWKFILLYVYDTVKWDISSELKNKIQKLIASEVCTYRDTGCSDCEFNHATNFNCPLGRD